MTETQQLNEREREKSAPFCYELKCLAFFVANAFLNEFSSFALYWKRKLVEVYNQKQSNTMTTCLASNRSLLFISFHPKQHYNIQAKSVCQMSDSSDENTENKKSACFQVIKMLYRIVNCLR